MGKIMDKSFDVIVVGLGGMGSSAAYQIALRGKSVLGLEQFGPAHDKGSSHGQSRIFRQAYFEGEAYVPLLLRARELWDQIQHDSGMDLFTITGGLFLGSPDSSVVTGSTGSARKYNLPHEILDSGQIRRRFPPFRPPKHFAGLYEVGAGVVKPEQAVLAHLEEARKHGAELHFDEAVLSVTPEASDGGVRITTAAGQYVCQRLVITCGPWAARVLADLQLPLVVERAIMHWFRPVDGPDLFLPDRFPIHLWELDTGEQFYGFPAMAGPQGGVKIAFHNRHLTPCDPDSLDRQVYDHEVQAMRQYVTAYIPPLNGDHLASKTCMYTMSPDKHFIIGPHPRHPSIVFAAGFSGHGFKFASVVGEILAELAIDGRTRHAIGAFDVARFGQLK
jgi:sarcosine oxidase